MSSYLLLRDNKQTGPYSFEEIVAKGFKPYDLVWLEGKSAGWRYPGELPELAPYAPLTEEQPFDRFYKKPAPSPSLLPEKSNAVRKEKLEASFAPPVSTPTAKVISLTSHKVAVILPGIAAPNSHPVQKIEPEIPVITNDPLPEPVVVSPKKMETGATENVITKEKEPVAYQAFIKPKAIEKTVSAWEKEENILPLPTHNKTFRLVPDGYFFKGAIAVCLLLGGIVIGLAINYSTQGQEKEQLAQKIQELKERNEARKLAANNGVIPAPPVTETIPASGAAVMQTVLTNSPEKETGNTPVKSSNEVGGTTNQSLPPATIKEEVKPIQPVQQEISKNQKEITVPSVDEKTLETLYRLVAIETGPYKTGILGGISEFQLTLSNNSQYALDNVEVTVKYLGPEKKLVNTQTIQVAALTPGEQRSVEVPRSKRGVTVSCSVNKISARSLSVVKSTL